MLKRAKLIFVTNIPSILISVSLLSMGALLSAGTVGYQVDTQIEIGQRISSISNGMLTLGKTNTNNFLVAGQYQINGIGKDTSWIASIGTGYRHLITPNMMLGAYLFTDMLKDHDGRHYYMLSPGLEFKIQQWSLVSNIYIPLGKSHYKNVVSAEDLGYAGNFVGSGNTATTDHIEYYDHAMMGIDAMIGYEPKWVSGLSIGLGGYHYRAKASDVGEDVLYTGIKTQVGYDLGKYVNVQAGYRYDKENKSRYMLALGINFNSRAQEDTLAQALVKPIKRHQNVNTTKEGIAVDEHRRIIRKTTEGVHFVHGTHGSSSGTGEYHSPYNSLDEALEASKDEKSPYIVLAGDHTYITPSGDITITKNNTTIVGRSSNYQTATKGSDANVAVVKIKEGGLVLSDGSYLKGFKLETVGSSVFDISQVTENINYGIKNNANNKVKIQDISIESAVVATDVSERKDVTSILNYGTINFSGSNSIEATVGAQHGYGWAYGVFGETNSRTTFKEGGDQTITATSAKGWAHGIFGDTNSITTFSGSGNQKITAKSSSGDGEAYGIFGSGSTTFSGSGNQIITAIAGSSRAYGVFGDTNSITTFSGGGNQTITAQSSSGQAYGVHDLGSTTFSSAGTSKISATVTDATGNSEVYGIINYGSVDFNQSTTTTISVESLGNNQDDAKIKPYNGVSDAEYPITPTIGVLSGADHVACFQNNSTAACGF